MLKDDWIMKIISQANSIMARILSALTEDTVEAQKLIDEVFEQFVESTSAEINQLSAENLINQFSGDGSEGIGRLILIADLLRAESAIQNEAGNENEAVGRLLKALDIRLSLAIGHDMINAHLDGNIDQLVDQLQEYELPTHTAQSLFNYYERTTHFDKAEDMLHELIDDHITNENMLEEGLAFYERLLRKNDTELKTGNLPRDEAQAGFDELWQRM